MEKFIIFLCNCYVVFLVVLAWKSKSWLTFLISYKKLFGWLHFYWLKVHKYFEVTASSCNLCNQPGVHVPKEPCPE